MDHPGLPTISEAEHQALDAIEFQREDPDAPASPDELALARSLVDGITQALWRSVGQAIRHFAPHAPAEHQLDSEALDRAMATFGEQPAKALGLTTVRELVAEALGAEKDGGVDHWLQACARESELDTDTFALDRALVGWVRSAYPNPKKAGAAIAPAARVLRCALVRDFHPELRAAALAAEQPETVGFALELVLAHPDDVGAQIEAMASARAEAEAKGLAPGPPRRFSKWHAIFAVLVAGLTAYQYWWR